MNGLRIVFAGRFMRIARFRLDGALHIMHFAEKMETCF